jgi:predicted metal-dependent enzyme (double-stranded beta helix superfamily)
MFDLEAFVAACQKLVREPHAPKLALELMREAVADGAAVAKAVTPLDGRANALDAPLFRSDELTILNATLRPGFVSIPHDHGMWAVIGIYDGEEANTFYRRAAGGLEESNRRTVRAGEAILLGADVIHAIENPLATQTFGLHVYGGDLVAAKRSMWDPTEGREHAYDIAQFFRWSGELARSHKAARESAL